MDLRRKLALASCALAFPLAAHAWAQNEEPPADPQQLYKQLDKNNDGFLLPSEAGGKDRAMVNRLVRSGDANKDGGLSPGEFAAAFEEDKKRPQEDEPEQPGEAGGPQPGIDPAAMINPQVVFARLDRDRDRVITVNELNPADRQVFGPMLSRFDRDGDGIDQREFMAAWPQLRVMIVGVTNQLQNNMRAGQGNPLFQALDTDGNGSLSAEEIDAAPEALRKLDANEDGAVDLAEVSPRGGAGAAGAGVASGGADRRATAAAASAERLVKRYLQSDSDGDGKLSQEEVPAALKRQFEQLDKNTDGFLDADELRAPRSREEGRGRRAGRRGREAAEEAGPGDQ
jgi:Ca2+-binding EF-hand superfamily protein